MFITNWIYKNVIPVKKIPLGYPFNLFLIIPISMGPLLEAGAGGYSPHGLLC